MSDIKDKYRYVIRKIKDRDDGSAEYEKDTCIGLTDEAGRYQGVIYKYGEVSIPNEDELNSEGDLPFRFKYVIVDNNKYPEEYFKDDFRNLIGDILVDIITNSVDEDLTEELDEEKN